MHTKNDVIQQDSCFFKAIIRLPSARALKIETLHENEKKKDKNLMQNTRVFTHIHTHTHTCKEISAPVTMRQCGRRDR